MSTNSIVNPSAPKKPRTRRFWLIGLPLFLVVCAGLALMLVPRGPQATVPVVAPLQVTPAAPAPADAPLALVNGLLIDGTGAEPVSNAVVLVKDGRIQAAGPRDQVTIPPEYQVVDVQGAAILPGLINAHVHYAFDVNRLKTWAQAGVTTVREMGVIVPGESLDKRYMLRDNSRIDPQLARVVAATLIISPSNGYGYIDANSPAEARSVTTKAIDEGAEVVKLAFEEYLPPFRFFQLLPVATAKELVKVAHERGLRATVHITWAKFVSSALEAGVDEIAHMPQDPMSDEVIQRAVQANVMFTPTLTLRAVFGKTNLGWLFGDEQAGLGTAKDSIDNLRRFVAAGGQVALGTDYGGTPGTFQDGLPMLELELMQQAGMTPMQILVAATHNAAIACSKSAELGTLEAGKIADILVVDGNPLADLHHLQNVRLVIKSGAIIRQK